MLLSIDSEKATINTANRLRQRRRIYPVCGVLDCGGDFMPVLWAHGGN